MTRLALHVTALGLAAAFPASARAALFELTFGGTVLQVVHTPGGEPPAFASAAVGDSYSLRVLFAEGVPDQCVAGCSQGDPDVLGLYAFESMTLQIGLETYTWTNGTRTEVFNDQHFPPGPCDAVECGPPPPDQVRDGFFLESDPYWYAFAIPRTDRVHALLALQDFTATRLTSDAVPSPSELALPGSPPWTSQLNMYAENADATQTIWALGADVTSSSARTVPEPGALQWLLLGLGAFLARPAR